MENAKRNFRGHGLRGRFFGWVKSKMTGEDAFGIMYGERGGECPKEMKEEFVVLFDQMKEAHTKLHEGRKAFMDKWNEYIPEDCKHGHDHCHGGDGHFGEHFGAHFGGHFGGRPFDGRDFGFGGGHCNGRGHHDHGFGR